MPQETILSQLQTRRNDVGMTRVVQGPLPSPAEGEILLRVVRFALSANNITYAAFGDADGLHYWKFFPTGDPEWGHMPVWGFADVIVSEVEGIACGERFYGYFPPASHAVMRPVRVSERGFYDGAPHRQELVSAYNQYTRCGSDPAYEPAREAHQMLFRPLFITSFMLADFLRENGFFGATRLVFSSASSKTAYGTAFCLMDDPAVEAVALTSAANSEFTGDLGSYRQVFAYDELDRISADTPTLYVDFSGDGALRWRVHGHFRSALVYDCFAGSAQNNAAFEPGAIPGPEPRFYFAPTQIRKRNADWGAAELTRRINDAQSRFFDWLDDDARLRIAKGAGLEAAREVVTELCAGRTDPRKGHVIEMG